MNKLDVSNIYTWSTTYPVLILPHDHSYYSQILTVNPLQWTQAYWGSSAWTLQEISS